MQKGSKLEHYINTIIREVLTPTGLHAHKNNPTRTTSGLYLHGEPFDYELFLPNAIHLFDAKECSDKKLHWNISHFKNPNHRYFKQFQALWACSKAGSFIQAYFLVWFIASPTPTHLVRFDLYNIIAALNSRKNFITPKEGISWQLNL